jgi:hypothetical protein
MKGRNMKIAFPRLVVGTVITLVFSVGSFAQVGVAIRFGPPPLPVYEQPLCPGEGYLWTPGYWAYDYDDADFFWVPGTWVLAPEAGLLWTPGYWGWEDGGFLFHQGYWGPRVGFYGGINYGFGYFGDDYQGGRWENGRFYYNRSVNNVNETNIHNVYNTTVINNTNVSRVSYNGGNGGVNARPTSVQEAAAREKHLSPVAAQTAHVQTARSDQQLRASVNQGKPPVAATPKPGALRDHAAVPASQAGGTYRPPVGRTGAQAEGAPPAAHEETATARSGAAVHPNDLPPVAHAPAPNSGDPKMDQKYQQQQEKLKAQQQQERQKLQQEQERDHQQLEQQQADAARKQQMEEQHRQQTQQLQQQHEQQQQRLQARQPGPPQNQARSQSPK